MVAYTKGCHSIRLEYLLHVTDATYNTLWSFRVEKLCNRASHCGTGLITDQQILYDIYVEYIGTTDMDYNIINVHK